MLKITIFIEDVKSAEEIKEAKDREYKESLEWLREILSSYER